MDIHKIIIPTPYAVGDVNAFLVKGDALTLFDASKRYSASEACEIVKKTSHVKYDAPIRVSFKMNLDPRQADQQIRGAMVLPNGTGRSQKILVVTQGPKTEEAKNAGADYVGEGNRHEGCCV